MTTPSVSASYTSDARNLRQSRTVGSVTQQFTWSSVGALPLLLDDGEHSYIYGASSTPIAQVDATGEVEYLHADLLGTPRLVTDDTGAAVGTVSFDAFGTIAAQSGVQSSFGFTGNWSDPDTGLLYLRARDYDPATGQFLTVDPLVDQTRQPYAYTGNSPVSLTDPTGLDPCLGYNDWACLSEQNNHYIPTPSAEELAEEAAYQCLLAELDRRSYEQAEPWQRALWPYVMWTRKWAPPVQMTIAVLGGGYAASRLPYGTKTGAPARVNLDSATPWRGDFPRNAGPNSVLARRDDQGRVTNYQVYGSDGLPLMRVDVTGKPHAGIPTPHVQPFGRDASPDGNIWVNKGQVRPAEPWEIPDE